ncbi:Neuropeptide-Like Protein [Caenorhabditis elegans]|uniref:Neuropeptide-Like Protein n=1 Tax=Caenorhabditis elegans TaxID=6239 RepID=Q7YTR0_CAEEL|nr:Neuropeptide-Like Protein [Caenorhabditis elegans]CAE17734.1 Neuropeptide-Like Protein [Caenorhabditis elegans]|eukprot:NP_001023125.1 Neuropeptide-Like Protein [Caenorhabditis elegans]
MSTRWFVFVALMALVLLSAHTTEAMPRPGQMSLSNTRNCFFSPMGCVFVPKMSRIRKLSADFRNEIPPPDYI